MQIVRPVVKTATGVRDTVRDVARLQEVGAVLARHGFGWMLTRIGFPGFRAGGEFAETTPERASRALQQLGPTFIKLGQVLSTRPDVLPERYLEAFQQLQDDVDPLPLEHIEQQMQAELGDDWQQRFRHFDDAPLATASIAQVHKAVLDDGTRVVCKVQRPGIGTKITSDLSILHWLAGRVLAEFPEAQGLDLDGVLAEFERSITGELDFRAEARNIERFRADFAELDIVRVPAVYDALSTERVLCLEYLDGVKIRDAREAGLDMDKVGARYLQVAYTMLFEQGFFHGDLHPGNVLVLEGEVIGLLDFGMCGSLTRSMKDSLVSLIFALERGDTRTIARIFFDIAIKSERVDYAAFEADVVRVVERNWVGTSVQSMQIGRFLADVTQGAVRHNVRAPHSYTMFFKALLTTEGLAKSLIPETDPLAAASPYIQKLISQRYDGDRLREDLFYNLVTAETLARRLPVSLSQMVEDIDRQRVKLTTVDQEAPETQAARDRRLNRAIVAAITCTGFACGALALDTLWWDVPLLSLAFWMASAPLLLLTLTMTLRNRG
jgi:ubiquinone biosynthesis protein